MNCRDAREHWNLYHDSEGDAEVHFEISEHLEHCSACAQWFAQQRWLENTFVARLATHNRNAALWERLTARAGLVEPVRPRRWFVLASLAATAALVLLALGVGRLAWPPEDGGETANLSHLTASLHDRLVSGDTPVALASHSDLAVEEFLRSKVNFPVRCPPRKDSGFAVRGAGTCRLGTEPVAYVAGYVDRAPVSIFILSKESLAAFPIQRAALAADTIHRCREGDYEMALSVMDKNLVIVVGRLASQPLLRVLTAYGTYPDSHG
jgi:predicted anti-sigma-YlaC factor YlaD